MKNFKTLGNIDVSPYDYIIDEEWHNEATVIRQTVEPNQRHVGVIALRWNVGHFLEIAKTGDISIQAPKSADYDKYYNKEFFDELFNIFTEKVGEGYPVRIVFLNMPPGKVVYPHKDKGISVLKNHRIHIPIYTNNDVIFSIEDENKNMKRGEIVEIDNTLMHDVRNDGDTPRIHLLVDWYVKGTTNE